MTLTYWLLGVTLVYMYPIPYSVPSLTLTKIYLLEGSLVVRFVLLVQSWIKNPFLFEKLDKSYCND